ncbi:C2 [Turnip curly top virus]|uniref:C2 n=1 Tax=Turnip curly top virus TaxID=859650 RepID=D8WZ35_9GEMI|nr:C2 [Turnip curly top virus]AGA19518.1 C2 [Turnip curly top virus]AGA19524.1 C2 [Turnip curly top virus]AGA19530.1 C2 [Turnip curly top virus]AGA19554.1 C2 [Turnip curly top virus]
MKPLSPGVYKIQSSQRSRNLSSISRVIKKSKTVLLPCKCKFTIHHECGEGFTHRGTHHASSIDDWNIHTPSTQPIPPQTNIMDPPGERVLQHQIAAPLQLQSTEAAGITHGLDRIHGIGSSPEFDWTKIYDDFFEEITLLPK